jgi:hypothetical protein
MKNNNFSTLRLNESHAEQLKIIWQQTHPDNLKSIIGERMVEKYLEMYLKDEKNQGFGLYDTNKLVGFVLFGAKNTIVKKLIREELFYIFKSFFSNLVKLNIKYLINYFNIFFFLLISMRLEDKLKKENVELLIISIKQSKQGSGLGSFLIKDVLKKNKTYFKNYKNIFVKTLKSTPQNIIFYQKNNFNLLCSSFGRAYLLFKI